MSDMNDTYVITANDVTNRVLIGISASLSTIGAFIIIATYAFIKDIRTVSRHVIFCISVADLATCISNLAGLFVPPNLENSTSKGCKIQSFLGTTAVMASFMWTMILAVYLYIAIVRGSQELGKKIIIPWSHFICWGVPIAINLAALAEDMLGNDGDRTSSGWCWIRFYRDDGRLLLRDKLLLWMILDGKGIEIITNVVIFVLYVLIKLHLRIKIHNFNRSDSPYGTFLTKRTVRAAKQTDKKLIFIPMVLVVLRIWGTLRFFLYIKDYGNSDLAKRNLSTAEEVLLRLHAVGDNLQGFMNCLLFCFFTPKVRRHITACCCRCWARITRRFSYKDIDELDSESSGEFLESHLKNAY